MAFYPCSNHHAPYRGPSRAAYPAIVNGGSADRKHLRMCDPCFSTYVEGLASTLNEVDFGGTDVVDHDAEKVCSWCKAASPPFSIFVNAYPKGEPERDFFGFACDQHEAQARAEVLLS